MTPCVVNLSNQIFPIFTRLLLFFVITHVNFFLLNCDENNRFKTVSQCFSCIEIIINYWTSWVNYHSFIKLRFVFSTFFYSSKQVTTRLPKVQQSKPSLHVYKIEGNAHAQSIICS